ncbi:MAG: CcmD family protein [Polyangiaceae bacterium]
MSQPQGGSPPPSSTTSPDGRATEFRPVSGGGQMQSGELLLVEAYAAMWLIAFALILFSWSRVRKVDDRLAALEGAMQKARAGGDKPASPRAE